MTSHLARFAVALLVLSTSVSCFRVQSSEGGGQTYFDAPRPIDTKDVVVPRGYKVEVVATHLDFPTAVAFDDRGQPYVTLAGYSYGDVITTPRLVRIDGRMQHTLIAEGDNPPWTGIDYADGAFYVAGGHIDRGQIMRITPQGEKTTLIDGLPTLGDHFLGQLTLHDGWMYFGTGTATNSGVVGLDNFKFGWPKRAPDFHDIPCKDLVLAGMDYVTPNPLTEDPDDEAVTGAFMPFGTPSTEGQVIKGAVPCSGAIYRARLDGSEMELLAWGFRNPYGIALAPDGTVYIAENQFDVRGSRPIFGTGDLLWRLERGAWYGWPDYYAGMPINKDSFEPPGGETVDARLGFVLAEHPQKPPRPVAAFGVHSSSNGMAFPHDASFGFEGQAFVAQFGDMAPAVGKVLEPVGFKVVRVDVNTGVIDNFAVNMGKTNGPASWLDNGGLERPVSVAFGPDGALWIVDFGVMTVSEDGAIQPRLGTGVLWRVSKTGGAP